MRLYRNKDSYQGECIDIDAILTDISLRAPAGGWEPVPIPVSPSLQLPAFQRLVLQPRSSLYISSGIHGDEPAGPLAVQQLLTGVDWPEDVNVWLVPCLNPAGFRLSCRGNEDGVDLNRDYLTRKTNIVRAHTAWLDQRPRFDLSLLLHEDWESHGFYLYELNPEELPSLAPAIIEGVKPVCPVDLSPVIEGRPAEGGIIRPVGDLGRRTDWPEAFYLVNHKHSLNYTFESPSDFPLAIRTAALVAGVRTVVDELARRERPFAVPAS